MATKPYQIALSFAGEDRTVVEEIASMLVAKGIRVFYDRYEEATLWGRNLYTHLTDIYQNQAEFTLIFVSKYYASKLWTTLERESAQARAFEEGREYILPVRLDDSEAPGVLRTVGYVDLRKRSAEDLCRLIDQKLKRLKRAEPRHYIVQVDGLVSHYRPAGYISIEVPRPGDSKMLVYLDPSRYESFAEITDDLFSSYLVGFVDAYTYGSKWVLADQWRSHRVLVPPSWLKSFGEPLYQLDPTWSDNAPAILALDGSSRWSVVSLDDESLRPTRLYGLACNSERLESGMIQDPKAVMLFTRDGSLTQSSMNNVRLEDFSRVHVFIDWLSIISRTSDDVQVLLESGPVSEATNQRLKSRRRPPSEDYR